MEGGIRTPCIIRWPGRIPAGRVSNEIVHEVDLFPTLAAAVGADIVPKDRAIDGVNQLPFLEGQAGRSRAATACIFYANTQLRAVKWHDWKLHYAFSPSRAAPPVPPLMRLFNLLSDPKEEIGHQGRESVGAERDGQESSRISWRRPSAIRTCRRTRQTRTCLRRSSTKTNHEAATEAQTLRESSSSTRTTCL